MPKARLDKDHSNFLVFHCEGCGHNHHINIDPATGRPTWGFNGDFEKPTVTPSVLNRWGHYVPGQPQPPNCKHCDHDAGGSCGICHIFVTDGQIQYLSDCTHHLAGQTLPLKDL